MLATALLVATPSFLLAEAATKPVAALGAQPVLAMALSEDGSLDTSFGTGGSVTTGIDTNGPDSAMETAVQADGKIIVAGTSTRDFAAVRYNTDGSLDTNFGTGGKVTTDVDSGSDDSANAVALQSDGKIIVVGTSARDFAAVRYNTDGSLDTSFGTGGKVTTDIFNSTDSRDEGHDIALQSDGKIVVVGWSHEDFTAMRYYFAVVRYNTDGSLDTSFHTDGIATTDAGSGTRITDEHYGYAVALQSDGKIVAVGQIDTHFGVVRYNADGSLDTTFDTDGIVTTHMSPALEKDRAYAVVVQGDGKLVVVGAASADLGMVRYNADGSLDTTFDTDGIVTVTDYRGVDVALESDGKIVVAGERGNDFSAMRYNADGTLDTSFDTDGVTLTNIGASVTRDHPQGLALQSDGKMVVAGTSNEDFAVVRYNTDGTLDTNFGTGGKATTGFDANGPDAAQAVVMQSDGKILVAGTSGPSLHSRIAVVRYNTDGTLDTNFGTGGITTTPTTTYDTAAATAIQPDNKIIITGTSAGNFTAIRYNTDGTLDTNFGTGGITTTPTTTYDTAAATAIQPDNKIIITGTSAGNFTAIRYNTDGTLDTNFGTGGITTTPTTTYDTAAATAIQPDNKIIITGTSAGNFTTIRYNTDGTLDTNFGTGGITTTPTTTYDTAAATAIQPDNKIIITGTSAGNFTAIRYNTDGTLDTNFGTGGITTTPTTTYDTAAATAIQPDNKIIITGTSAGNFTAIRYNTDGTLDTNFGTGGITTTPTTTYDTAAATAIQPDNKIIITGTRNDDFVVIRYKATSSERRSTPDPPTNVRATPSENGFAVVSWQPPPSDGGGAPIVDYTVMADPGERTCTADGATTCTLTGLTNGTQYTVTVMAHNAVGTSPNSAPSQFTVPHRDGGGGGGGSRGGGGGGGSPQLQVEQVPEDPVTFSDVDADAWYAPYVTQIARLGVTGGYPDGTYRPAGLVTRAQMAAFLVRALGSDPVEAPSSRFADTPSDAWYAPYVERIAELGITDGCNDDGTHFCPRSPVTRSQMALFLKRAFDLPAAPAADPTFEDVGSDHYAYHAIEALRAAEITGGCSTEPPLYCPETPVTRAQMAVFLSSALSLTEA